MTGHDHEQVRQGPNNDPAAVRAALRVGGGDEIAYRIKGDHLILTKAKREPVDAPFATFHEWSSEADRRAFGDL